MSRGLVVFSMECNTSTNCCVFSRGVPKFLPLLYRFLPGKEIFLNVKVKNSTDWNIFVSFGWGYIPLNFVQKLWCNFFSDWGVGADCGGEGIRIESNIYFKIVRVPWVTHNFSVWDVLAPNSRANMNVNSAGYIWIYIGGRSNKSKKGYCQMIKRIVIK